MNLFSVALVFVVMGVGIDFMARAMGPRPHAAYRRMVGRAFASFRRALARQIRWIWRNYWQFIVGFITGMLVVLYSTGRLP